MFAEVVGNATMWIADVAVRAARDACAVVHGMTTESADRRFRHAVNKMSTSTTVQGRFRQVDDGE